MLARRLGGSGAYCACAEAEFPVRPLADEAGEFAFLTGAAGEDEIAQTLGAVKVRRRSQLPGGMAQNTALEWYRQFRQSGDVDGNALGGCATSAPDRPPRKHDLGRHAGHFTLPP